MKGKTVLGTGALTGGSANFTTSALPVATNAIAAVYGGDSKFGYSTSNTVKQVVTKATTTTTLVSSLNPSNFGQSVTFTASMTSQFSGTVKGTVTFYDGTTTLKTVYQSGGWSSSQPPRWPRERTASRRPTTAMQALSAVRLH
jgi:hypothetical protein